MKRSRIKLQNGQIVIGYETGLMGERDNVDNISLVFLIPPSKKEDQDCPYLVFAIPETNNPDINGDYREMDNHPFINLEDIRELVFLYNNFGPF